MTFPDKADGGVWRNMAWACLVWSKKVGELLAAIKRFEREKFYLWANFMDVKTLCHHLRLRSIGMLLLFRVHRSSSPSAVWLSFNKFYYRKNQSQAFFSRVQCHPLFLSSREASKKLNKFMCSCRDSFPVDVTVDWNWHRVLWRRRS